MITVSSNKVVRLTIPSIQLQSGGENCEYDSIKIYDGMTATEQPVATLCGSQSDYALTSSTPFLLVKFTTDESQNFAGFTATVTEVDSPCGGTFNLNATGISTGNITSPGYPGNYPESLNCRWTVGAPFGEQVRFVVMDIDIEQTPQSNTDYLQFRESPLREHSEVHYCGATTPPQYDSASRVAVVNFVTNNIGTGRGFNITYSIADCSRNYTGDNGRVVSPGFPSRYQHRLNCSILITVPQGSKVALYFNFFQLEQHPNCNYDYLQVYNGSDSDAGLVGKYCSRVLPNPIFATGSSVFLNFVTDGSVNNVGFDLTYTSSPIGNGCGGNLTSINATLTSPGYPDNYTESQTCDWSIQLPVHRTITMTFVEFEIFGAADCTSDYLEVHAGSSVTSPLYGRYCGDSMPATITSQSNMMFLRYYSNGQGNSLRFMLKYVG